MLESDDPAVLGTCSLDKSQIDFYGNRLRKRLCMNENQLTFKKYECVVNMIISIQYKSFAWMWEHRIWNRMRTALLLFEMPPLRLILAQLFAPSPLLLPPVL